MEKNLNLFPQFLVRYPDNGIKNEEDKPISISEDDFELSLFAIDSLLHVMNMRMVMAAASIFMMFWTGRHPMRKFIIVAESIQRQAVQTKILTMIRKRKPFQMNQVRIR